MRRAAMVACLCAGVACAGDPLLESARRKIEMIQEDRAEPGSRVWLSRAELDAYARETALQAVPQGLRSLRLDLGNSSARGSALVDFVKVREAKGAASSPLVAWLLAGEQPVRAEARVESGAGRATVHILKVTVGRVAAQGAVLDFLIENFLMPYYPDAKIGTPFELAHNVDRLEISPAGVSVVIAPKR